MKELDEIRPEGSVEELIDIATECPSPQAAHLIKWAMSHFGKKEVCEGERLRKFALVHQDFVLG